ncbi:type 2 periplasmic-binding domain-containing protein [Roseomonas marmotae]|uniref:Tripartite tricarboxylate transporter substrate binding protein n=1 Tax=Roseomonas marmotae TaxID=2768161 RepID=A0ABS3KHA4_9PROT|nr:hypothetical protein [Roseomonas marmotae]MBO1076858.1 hypothetical protein [Roseomonas marmotae]QTI81194.1 hypothetical protein IAI58_17770 [Roseomonas marmotae]
MIWLGLLAPAGLPKAEQAQLNTDLRAVMADPRGGMVRPQRAGAATLLPQEFASYMPVETERFARFVQETGMRIE